MCVCVILKKVSRARDNYRYFIHTRRKQTENWNSSNWPVPQYIREFLVD